jgi:predicted dinucleotide-binding enzyme
LPNVQAHASVSTAPYNYHQEENALKTIGVIGAGNVGAGLATILVDLGYRVRIANSRGPETLKHVVQSTGGRAVDIETAICEAELLVLAIPLSQIPSLRPAITTSLSPGTTIIDVSNYVPHRDGRIEAIDEGMAETAWVAKQLGVPVVKALNSITADSLVTQGRPSGSQDRIALPVAGDDCRSRLAAMQFLDELGFDAIDTGPLADSWRQQPGQPAYCSDPTLKELPDLLRRADREQGPLNRDKAFALVAKLPTTFASQDLVKIARFSVGLDRLKPRSWLALLRMVTTLLPPRSVRHAGGLRNKQS